LKEIEEENATLKLKISTLGMVTQTRIDPAKISEEVARFVLDFERKIHTVPIEEQKLLIKKVISEIVVDREKGVVRFYVRRVPAVSPELSDLLQNKKGPADIASPESSGGRT